MTTLTGSRPDGLEILVHTPETEWTTVSSLEDVRRSVEQSRNFVWIEGCVSEVSVEAVDALADCLGLHHLAVEDAMKPRQRPKFERYENHMFAVMHELNEVDGQLEASQIACFIGRRYAFVLHQHSHRLLEQTRERLMNSGLEQRQGAAFLVHTLLDTVVDDYELIADAVEENVEELEELVLSDPRASTQRSLYSIKQRLARLRRYVLPVSRLLAGVVEEGHAGAAEMLTPGIRTYFRDVYDHTLRIADQVHNLDDLASAILDLVRVEQANAQNEVTKRLTAWAAIIAVPTLVASMLGMNVLFPGEGTAPAFWAAAGLMAAVALALYLFFKRREWI